MNVESQNELAKDYIVGRAAGCFFAHILFMQAFRIPEEAVNIPPLIPIGVGAYYKCLIVLSFGFLILGFVLLGTAFRRQPPDWAMRFSKRLWFAIAITTTALISLAFIDTAMLKLEDPWFPYILYGEFGWFIVFIFYSSVYSQKETFIRTWDWIVRLINSAWLFVRSCSRWILSHVQSLFPCLQRSRSRWRQK